MGSSMNSMKTYFTLWFAGLVAGVLIMERWRRTGRRLIPTSERAVDAVESAPATSALTMSPDKPRVSAVLVAGAKSDAVRVRHFVLRVTPWTPDPSPAELRGWSQAATAANTTDHPAY
jgi:hypothetical protein